MPRVPTSDGPQLRVNQLNPVRQQNVDVSSGLQALGRGLGNVAEAVDQYALQQDQTLADQADAQITSAWLKWDAENRTKFRGQNVDGYEPAAQEWWTKAAGEFGKDLSPRARALASRSLVRKQGTALANVTQFVGSERERFFDESAEAKVNTSIEFGVSTGDVAGAAQQVRQTLAEVGARKGWNTDMLAAETTKRLSTLHLTHIEKLVDTDADTALAYYQAAKERGEILPAAQPRFERALKEGTDNQFAAKAAAEWAALPLDEQLEKAGEIEDPERRKRTLTEIKNNHALVKDAERQREDRAADQAWQLAAQGKRVPASILSDMGGRARAQLQDHLEAKADRAVARAERRTSAAIKTNPTALAKVYDMMRDDPEGFKRLKMESLTTHFSPSDIEQVARLQQNMLKPSSEKDVITLNNAIDGYTGTMNKDDGALFKREAINAVDRFQIEKGRPPSAKERRQLLDDLAVEGVVEGMIWDTKKPRFEMTPDEKAKAKFPDNGSTPAAPVRVQTPAQARALPKGTRFIDPNGIERIR